MTKRTIRNSKNCIPGKILDRDLHASPYSDYSLWHAIKNLITTSVPRQPPLPIDYEAVSPLRFNLPDIEGAIAGLISKKAYGFDKIRTRC